MNYTFNEETKTYTVGETTCTEEEFLENYRICSSCHNAVPVADSIYCESDGEVYCADCANDQYIRQCTWCGRWYSEDDLVCTADTEAYFCIRCAQDHLARCYHCGDYYEDEEHLYYDDGTEEDYCYSCYEDLCDENAHYIKSYHTFKDEDDYTFYGEEKRSEVPYLGIELEIDKGEKPEQCAGHLYDTFGNFARYEHDGSLGDCGFEIISQPASIVYHEKMFPQYCQAFRCASEEFFYQSHDAGSCGLHIHLDRAYFEGKDELASSKLLFLFAKFWNELVRFSRRSPSQLHWCDQYGDSIKNTLTKHKNKSLNRYHALNLTNDETIEFRLWRGTLNPDTFLATLLFTARLAKIAKETPAVKLASMTWDELLGDDPRIKSYWDTRKKGDN